MGIILKGLSNSRKPSQLSNNKFNEFDESNSEGDGEKSMEEEGVYSSVHENDVLTMHK